MTRRGRSFYRLLLLLIPMLLTPAADGATSRKRVAVKQSPKVGTRAPARPAALPDTLVNLPAPTARINPSEGWKLVYAAGSGQVTSGSHTRLAELVSGSGGTLGVEFAAFDGNVSGICQRASVNADGVVDCDLEIWCDQPNVAGVPDRHGHSVHLRSDGSVTYAVITLNERGERKILGLGDSNALVAWYSK